ncbi:MAG TPA: rRNA adenine N-6-methyltransferase family protein, partial [Acidimicrobiales bacterium]|nr:rRNA adenine N-6-methyltransferase family protein [Acidimicrobiales bacterium]
MDDAGIRPGQVVVDLGAGLGALTGPLLDAGARVTAVELHPERADELRRRHPEAKVVCCPIEDFRWPRHPFRVVANPP